MLARPLTCTLFIAQLLCLSVKAQEPAVNPALYNGREYVRYSFQVDKGHAYFLVDSFLTGSVLYDGVICDHVNLLYDEYKDELVTTEIRGKELVQLIKSKIDSFSIGEYKFIHLRPDASLLNIPAFGFYQILHDGKNQVLKKEKKIIKENAGITVTFERSFETQSSYFVRIANRYYEVNSKKDILSLFEKNKRDISRYIKDNHLNYKKDPEELVSRVALYAETLTP